MRERYQPKKLFRLEEANKTLPLVSRIVKDVVSSYKEIVKTRSAIDAGVTDSGTSVEDLEERLEVQVDELKAFIEELEDLGCLVKDFQKGLVDFPARHEGRVVFLCWQMGEKEVLHWHEVDAGFGGRRPVEELFASR